MIIASTAPRKVPVLIAQKIGKAASAVTRLPTSIIVRFP